MSTYDIILRALELVEIGLDWFLSVLRNFKSQWTKDRTAVTGLYQSWEFLVLISPSPVWSRFFCSLATELPSTIPGRGDPWSKTRVGKEETNARVWEYLRSLSFCWKTPCF